MSGDPTQTYRQEAAELLEQLEQALLDLERRPNDADLVNTAFRALHTIKGSGAMFGFDAVAAFTHHVETAFDRVRNGEVEATAPLIAVALAAKDQIRTLIEAPDSADDAEGAAILRRLQAALDGPAVEPPPTAGITWRLRFRLPRDAMAMGTNPLLLLDELRALGPCAVAADGSAIPPLEALNPTECHIGWDVTLTTVQPRSAIEQVFLFVLDEMQLDLEPVSDQAAEPKPQDLAATPRGTSDRAPTSPATPTREAARTAAKPVTAHADPAPPHADAPPPRNSAGSIRVPAERLDDLMDQVGELVIAQSRLKQIAGNSHDPQVKAISEEIERLALELRDTTMGARLVPIGQLFGRFRRLVHDLSRELGKDITLALAGEETELDKTLIERLADPLIHLIRNSVDHGVEMPEQRTAAGKPRQGCVTLTACHLGHEVLITIADDGAGLDRARIQQRAEEQGLIAPGVRPNDSELFQLILQPGFSTAREVTSVSGRGVGLDVVRRAIDALRGNIDIASQPGQGTQITLRLPLTLAIIDGLLVRVGQGRYVIPLSAIEECVELSVADDTRSRGHTFMNIRGTLVPFLRLREIFNTHSPPDPFQKVVIVSATDQRVGLVVDQVIGDHQTVIKSLSKLHADVAAFSGATILGDGTVALILEVAHLVEIGQQHDEPMQAAE
ncbi:MAG TPA: chemotaxis protein CheA [Acetobacteraceae bacterium]|nr:chemotaxis protein CheA [Acetobacteraceae bacterium]